MWRMLLLAIAGAIVLACSVSGGSSKGPGEALTPEATNIEIFTVAPHDVDSAVDARAEPEVVAVGHCTQPRQQLFVWLPGTLGVVSPNAPLINLAARHCMQALGVNYTTATDALDDCRLEKEASACYEAWRLEKIDGIDRTAKIAILPQNSIERRLTMLLRFLAANRPSENWSRFLANDEVRWDLVIIGGVSQGGGQAAMVGKVHPVARVVMVSASADVIDNDSGPPPAWLSEAGATPPDRYYAIAHMRDNFWGRNQRNWSALGLDAFGPIVNVDSAEPPYGGSHRLTSDLECPDKSLDLCVHRIVNLPQLADKLTPAWEYLLGLR